MKKDTEWLKEEMVRNYPSQSEIDNPDYEIIAKIEIIQEALSLIDKLDEPEITEEQALNKLAESYPFSADGINGILQAQLTGYSPVSTVKFIQQKEPEKLYRVILPTPNNMAEIMFLVEGRRVITNWFCSSRIENYKHQFTEQEIKAIDERYWAFAEEVPNV